MIKCKIKKLIETARIPVRATIGSAAFDLYATSIIPSEEQISYGYLEYGTGICVEIPVGYVGLIYSRSSISNTGLILANGVGVVDSDYRGEIKLRFKYVKDSIMYHIGDKIGQLMVIKLPNVEFEEVVELSSTERGSGAFGSTGN